MKRIFCITLLGFLAACLAADADSVTLTLDPTDGTISGAPGATVGWGYTIDNNTGDYLIVDQSFFCESGQDPLYASCAPALGASTYSDFTSNNFILIAPDSSASASYDPSTQSGLGSYGIDLNATPGQSDVGSIVVAYELWDADPTMGPADMLCADPSSGVCDFEVTAAATVNVLGGTTATPEPRTVGLLSGGLVLLIIGFARRRRVVS